MFVSFHTLCCHSSGISGCCTGLSSCALASLHAVIVLLQRYDYFPKYPRISHVFIHLGTHCLLLSKKSSHSRSSLAGWRGSFRYLGCIPAGLHHTLVHARAQGLIVNCLSSIVAAGPRFLLHVGVFLSARGKKFSYTYQ